MAWVALFILICSLIITIVYSLFLWILNKTTNLSIPSLLMKKIKESPKGINKLDKKTKEKLQKLLQEIDQDEEVRRRK